MTNDKNIGINLDILKNKKVKVVSAKEALKDIIPIDWNEKVKNGKEKVVISPYKR